MYVAQDYGKYHDPLWEDKLSDEERKTNSDIHEMFFVDELMKDRKKFDTLLQKIARS